MDHPKPQHDDAPTPETVLRRAFDPELFRTLGHRLIDQLASHLDCALHDSRMPVLPWVDPEVMANTWPPDFPERGNENLNALLGRVLDAANHLHHPAYMGHQVPGPLPAAALCDLVASFLNNSTTVYEMGASGAGMERSVVRWMAATLGFGPQAGGVLTSGGSVGNLTGLLAARELHAAKCRRKPPALLVSDQAHYSILRAVRVMGWGAAGVETVPSDPRYRLPAEALEEHQHRAEARGRTIIGVVASACSTATGAYDPLPAIADFCEAKGLWLHVDAAHGGAASLSDKYRHLIDGIQRADSVVWDAHKMLLMPALVSGVIYKRGQDAYRAFEDEASYLYERTPEEEWYNYGHRTIECTKPMNCIKAYAMLHCYGTRLFGDYVTATYDLARRFAAMLREAPGFHSATAPESNIVCFRYIPDGAGDLDLLQAAIRRRLLADGNHYIVQTHLPAGLHLRTTLINPFTRENHLAALIGAVREAGDAIQRQG